MLKICLPLVQETVQPRIVEQVVACKDDIAQQYLMQCIIQGFPDEFHLASLDTLLQILPQLQPGVKIHIVLASLLDRLARCVCWNLVPHVLSHSHGPPFRPVLPPTTCQFGIVTLLIQADRSCLGSSAVFGLPLRSVRSFWLDLCAGQ